jgi:zinc transporter
LQAQHGLDPLIIEAMTAQETRPRVLVRPYGVMVILRAMNLHPGADPEDMISIRLWLDDKCVITARRRDIVAVEDIYQLIEQGRGPQTSGDFLATIVQRLFERMETVLEDLEDTLSAAEEQLALGNADDIAGAATLIRRRTAIFSRYIIPQRAVLEGLLNADISWLNSGHKEVLHECLDRVIRYVEELREIRERAQILNDDINNADSQRLNKITYMFSVAATVFLPLGFLTGLVGINLGGIPGAEHGYAFWWFAGACVVLGVLQVLIFKKLKWF